MATLTSKTALITGAPRGIGRATAKALANAGARVIAHYSRTAAETDAFVKEIRASGGQADAASADLSLPDDVADLATQVRAIGGEQLDVLVSNAGISKAATIRDHTVEDFDKLFATNVRGPFFLIQQLLPILREGSNIIVISSAGARTVVGKPGVEKTEITGTIVQFRYGKGRLIISTFDLLKTLIEDSVATIMFNDLVKYAACDFQCQTELKPD